MPASPLDPDHPLRRRRGRTRRDDAGLPAGAGRRRRVVLEKHGDFLRDFRGDTIHPSTLEVIRELGLLDRFRPLLQNEIRGLDVVVSAAPAHPGRLLHAAAAVRVPRADAAVGLPGLPGRRGAALPDLPPGDGGGGDRPALGARPGPRRAARTPDGRAGGDRRPDRRRRRPRLAGPALAGLAVRELGVPVDVLWFRLPKPAPATRRPRSPTSTGGDLVLTIDRGDYYQSGMLIPKGGLGRIRAAGPAGAARAARARRAGPARRRRRARRPGTRSSCCRCRSTGWSGGTGPGCCASATPRTPCRRRSGSGSTTRCRTPSPPRTCWRPTCAAGRCSTRRLARVQRRRELPVRLMQPIQLLLHRRVIRPGGPAGAGARETLPAPVRLLGRAVQPVVQRLRPGSSAWGSARSGSGCRWPVWRRRRRRAGRRSAGASGSAAEAGRPEQRLEVAEQRR